VSCSGNPVVVSDKVPPKLRVTFTTTLVSYMCSSEPHTVYETAEFGFKFIFCSPHYHQSNGHAERAVGMARKFLDKCNSDPNVTLNDCLLQYRSTPIPKLSATPSQLLMSRILKTELPVKTTVLKPCVVNIHDKLETVQREMAQSYNKSASRNEIDFKIDDYVLVQNVLTKKWEPGVVMEVCREPSSYIVQVNDGTYRRNMSMTKPRHGDVNEINENDLNTYELYNQVFASPVVNEIPVVNEMS